MVARRGFKGGARQTTIVGDISNAVTTITAADLSTWAGMTSNGAATATINRGFSDEETVTFTGISGNNLTGVTRGQAGTSAQAHSSGATIEHTSSVTDFDDANAHIADTTRDDHTQYAKKSLFAAKGTILAASAASTPAGLAVGTDGQVLTADAASADGVKWATPSASSLLSHVQYAPGSSTTKGFGGTAAVAAIDTTNMRLPDFVAPASGTVRVTIGGFVFLASSDTLRPSVCIVTQGTTTCVGSLLMVEAGQTAYGHPFHVEEYITGLTPGTTYHWDVGGASNSSSALIYCYGGTTVSTLGSPFVCSVFSV